MKPLRIQNLGKTNLVFSCIAVAGYITIYFGFIPHMSLGLFQVILCLFLLFKKYELIKKFKEHLTIYGALVITDLSLFYINDGQFAIWAWAGSFLIAFYFTYIMYQLKYVHYENNQ
ncbi:MAG: hypothetical protein ABJM06_14605 [Gilvibacter sp.]